MNIHFFAINNIGVGLSGGDSIWINLAKYWDERYLEPRTCCNLRSFVTVWGSKSALDSRDGIGIKGRGICVYDYTPKSVFSKWGIFCNTVVKLYQGVKYIWRYRRNFEDNDIMYSVSDFYPDFIPALMIKLYNPKVRWVAGFYLFAPFPSTGSPYRHDFFRGFAYWLSQRVSYPLIKRFADCVFVTSDIDKDKFPRTVVIRGGV